ncbi:MAG: hypothetical protein GY795_04470 [Desulfobacterales bacterium]|nr:hypothetical protein [Desulfobacterales bacterium]
MQIVLGVHYGDNESNACWWDGRIILLGDGDGFRHHPFTVLDIVAHEISHGFTEQRSGLTYNSFEPGAINEAFSDMAGEAAKYHFRGETDFKLGYDCVREPDSASRYMDNPTRDGISIEHLDYYRVDPDIKPAKANHYNSGLYNKAFYLLATTNKANGGEENWNVKRAFDVFWFANRNYWKYNTVFTIGFCDIIDAALELNKKLSDSNTPGTLGYLLSNATNDNFNNYSITDIKSAFKQVGIYCAAQPDDSNEPPSIEIIQPDGVDDILLVDQQPFNITWGDLDPDSNATIEFYLDTDSQGENGQRIYTSKIISEDDEKEDGYEVNLYEWDTSELAAGTYYIYAKIYDEENEVIKYSEGPVTITDDDLFCNNIPITSTYSPLECNALAALYKSTNGSNWNNNKNWFLNYDIHTWYGVSIDTGGHVRVIDLSDNNLQGTIPDEIGNLNSLRKLHLNKNQLTSEIPSAIDGMTNLRELYLDENQLISEIPSAIGDLTNLKILKLDKNQLTSIPPEIGKLTNLNRLYLGENQFSSIPHEIDKLTNLTHLFLNENQLISIPSEFEIGKLTKLTFLNLNKTNLTSIPDEIDKPCIPHEIGKLTKLVLLNLSENSLSFIPDELEIGNLTYLEQLYLNSNQLTSIPDDICKLSNLQYLDINDNMLEDLPDFSNCFNLSRLKIENNQLTFNDIEPNIDIASEFTYEPQSDIKINENEKKVELSEGEEYTIYIPADIGGTNYKWYKNGEEIQEAEDSYYTFSQFSPEDIGNYTYEVTNWKLPLLTLKSEKINVNLVVKYNCAEIKDVPIEECEALVALYKSTNGTYWIDNKKEGWLKNEYVSTWNGVTVSNGHVEEINLKSSRLSGEIPSDIDKLTMLLSLDISSNNFDSFDGSEPLPPEIGNLTNLKYLYLNSNRLKSIPDEIVNLINLEHLTLTNNQIESIPNDIDKLANLTQLKISDNHLKSIPNTIDKLVNLTWLTLSQNNLKSIPEEVKISKLIRLTHLHLNYNELVSIPNDIGGLSNLEILNLSHNELASIPDIHNLNLEYLNIQNNQLTFKDIEPIIGIAGQFKYTPQNNIGEPDDVFLYEGSNHTISVLPGAGGSSPVYEWYKDNNINPILGALKESYTVSSFSSDKAGAYYYKITSTNPQVSGLTLQSNKINLILGEEPQGSLYFPHVATVDGWKTEIAVINPSNRTIVGKLKAYNNSGNEINTENLAIDSHGRKEINISEYFTNSNDIGHIIFEADSDVMVGYVKFYTDRYRAAVPAVKDTKINTGDIFIPHIATEKAGWWTGISLVNTTSDSKRITIEFDTGITKTVTILAKGHKAFLIKEDVNSAVIKDAEGVIGLELFGTTQKHGDNYLAGFLLKDDTAHTVYYPYIAETDEWWTGIVAYNTSDTENNTLTITPYKKDGTVLTPKEDTIAAKDKYIGFFKKLNLSDETAWLKIESTEPSTGFELFGTLDHNQLAGYSGVNISTKKGIFPKSKYYRLVTLVFVNAGNDSASIKLTGYDDDGNVVAVDTIESLDPNEKIETYNTYLFRGSDKTGITYIEFSSSQEIVAFQLNGSRNNMLLDALPALSIDSEPEKPMLDNGEALAILKPNKTGNIANQNFEITWTDDVPDYDAYISLYYDQDNTGQDGTLIVADLSEDSEDDFYTWNTSSLPEGSYYIYAKVEDPVNEPLIYYSDGPVTVVRIEEKADLTVKNITYKNGEIQAQICNYGNIPVTTEIGGYPLIHFEDISDSGLIAPLSVSADTSGISWGDDLSAAGEINPYHCAIASVLPQSISINSSGTYNIKVYTDLDDQIYESDETNNNKEAQITIDLDNTPPAVTITAPGTGDNTADQYFVITWTDHDPDNNAKIRLCYDADNTGQDSILIASDISEDNETDTYIWNTSQISEGDYYICAVISDSINAPVTTYSTHPVTVTHQATVNTPPDIEISEPDGADDTTDRYFTITWTDSDPDDNAQISLYYDTDNRGQDGTLIASNLSEDSTADYYNWNTSQVPEGSYHIYAVIRDSVNAPVVKYSSGKITIDHPPVLTLSDFAISESHLNDGTVSETQAVTLTNSTFAADMSAGVTVTSLPNGLNAEITRNSDTRITVAFTGKAVNHSNSNDTLSSVTIAQNRIIGAESDVTSGNFYFNFNDPPPSNLIGCWGMENNTHDYSHTGNHGTPQNGTEFTKSARIGYYAARFDGTDDYVALDSLPDLSGNQATFAFWIKPENVNSDRVQKILHLGLDFYGGITIQQTGDYLGFAWLPNTNTCAYITGMQYNQWHHVVYTYDNKKIRAYLNGQEVMESHIDSWNGRNFSEIPAQHATIGAEYFSGDRTGHFQGVLDDVENSVHPPKLLNGITGHFQGVLDDVRIYNKALTAEESREIYEHGKTTVVLHIDDKNTAQGIEDISGQNHPVAANGNTAYTRENKVSYRSGLSFDGQNDYLEIPASGDWNFSNEDFTIDFWMNARTLRQSSIFDLPGGWEIRLSDDQDGTFSLGLYDSDDELICTGQADFLSADTWNHIAAVRNHDTVSLYLNGTEVGACQQTRTLGTDTGSLIIGAAYNSSYTEYFHGWLDQIRIHKGEALWTDNFTPPINDLEVYYKFENDNFQDYSGAVNYGIKRGNASFSQAAKTGSYALSLDGNESAVELNHGINAKEYTISVWISPQDLNTAQRIFNFGTDWYGANSLRTDNGRLKYHCGGSILFINGIQTGAWTHLTFTMNESGEVTVYVGCSLFRTTPNQIMLIF